MSSPAAAEEEESTDVEVDEDDLDEEDYDSSDLDSDEEDEGSSDEEESNGETRVAAEGPTRCICMEPWTCNDAHRTCSIPCGHVYGRSCVEKWLNRCVKAEYTSKFIKLKAEVDSQLQQCRADNAKSIARTRCEVSDMHSKLAEQLRSDIRGLTRQALVEEAAKLVKTNFVSLKAQMKKLVEENATPMDLIEFMEQNYNKLSIPSSPRDDASSEAPAPL
ncbi:hypothetical protein PR202_ga27360 [Eleusine coracana subsp. coracana]|uniref:RING-type domain-containing protein n=1 Tax=Eleusine coracana subsp. coracana TaxID=191504 RepID=A0AAV5DED3_ELECO|nr:hypothetical protein PR202_ga27360 [Eleusine coracana subsp. coracana]